VLDRSKLNEEVDMMLAQQKIQAKKEKKKSESRPESTITQTQPKVKETAASQQNVRAVTEILIDQVDDEVDELPDVIKPLPKLDSPTASVAQPLSSLIEDMEKEGEITQQQFENKNAMKQYERDDYKIKAFLMLVKAGKKNKMWMPGKTSFDKRGGKFSERVGGLGQIAGLH